MNLKTGHQLAGGRYRVEKVLGAGGFGITYEARDTKFKSRVKSVAIKEFFVKDFCNREQETNRIIVATQSKVELVKKLQNKFIDEANALFELEHPGIVRVTDTFEENGTAYYVMEYINGSSLSNIIEREGSLNESMALGYIRQAASALEYLHGQNRLHLDIKPQNIMVDNDGRVVLIDFGVSKQYDEVNGENTSTLLGSTPGYAPIEQSGSGVAEFYPSTDIYSLGATLYKLLTGNTPLPAHQLASGETLPPLPHSVSTATRKAVESAMSLNRNNRPQSIGEFLSLLECHSEQSEESQSGDDDGTTAVASSDGGEESGKRKDESGKMKVERKKQRPSAKKLTAIIIAALLCIVAVVFFVFGGSNATSTINGHEYVDLGLSVKWATCNVGASSPGDYGYHYAWGETTGTKSDYSPSTSTTEGKRMNSIAGNSTYDVARREWGGTWRLPTEKEFQELIDNCTWTWTTQNGHNGYKVTSKKNGNSIFLPAAGSYYDTSLEDQGTFGGYWSATPYENIEMEPDDTDYAYYLRFNDCDLYMNWYFRCYGHSVRPVSE